MHKVRITLFLLMAAAILVLALCAGPRTINPLAMTATEREILLSIRLPRVAVALLMGMALGASGAILQGVLRNPLADPYILGISSGASLAAALGLLAGFYVFGGSSVPVSAFIGASLVSILVGAFGWKRGGLWPERLLLAGIGLNFLFSAVLMLLMSLSSDEGLRRAVLWMFGDLSMADWTLIPSASVFIIIGLGIALFRSKALNALILGDEFAYSLGFAVQRERLILFVAMALMTSASVSLGGTIGFIGLLMPHIVRFLLGADSRLLVPASAVAGGAFLCFADLIGRSLMPPLELPSGTVTAVIGAPYFLYLLRKKDVLGV
ncbi:MAG: transport system permease protein [Nitrospirae bacterium]|nr:transport system permease protein [Nitrospirota bacterium]MBS1192383.1 transport system permease protein [Nitrospirota bacterium]